jgi:group I intron endonuclease
MESQRKEKDYSQAKIYKIINSVNDKIYVGSTCSKLCKRMADHRSSAKDISSRRDSPFYTAIRNIGVENFKIILIKNFPCSSSDELTSEEYCVMKELQEKGEELYNDYIGCVSKETKQKISNATKGEKNPMFGRTGENHPHFGRTGEKHPMFGKIGKNSSNFSYGSIHYCKTQNRWCFSWRENSKQKSKTFPIKRYGEWAKLLAEDYRKKIYPESVDESQYVEIIFLD